MTPGTPQPPGADQFARQSASLSRMARWISCRLGSTSCRSARGVGNEQGSALVEFALSAVLLLTLIFGVMAISVALYSYNVVSEAAREGTRYAIVRGNKCNSFASACPANVDGSDVQTYIRSLSFPGITPGNLTAASVYSSVNAAACTPSASCNNPGNQVKVTVTYSFPLIIPFVPNRTLTMSNSSQMVISQ